MKYGVPLIPIVVAIIAIFSSATAATQVKGIQLERLKQPRQATTSPSLSAKQFSVVHQFDSGYAIVKQLLESDEDLDGVLNIEPGTVDECPTTPYIYVRLITADWSGMEGETWVETIRDGLSSDIVLDGVRLRLISPVVGNPVFMFPEGAGNKMPPGGAMSIPKYDEAIVHVRGTNYNVRYVAISDNTVGFIFSHIVSIPVAWIYDDDPHYQFWKDLYLVIYPYYTQARLAGFEPQRPGCSLNLLAPDTPVE